MSKTTTPTFDHNVVTAKSRYDKLVGNRKAYTDRAEKCAKYTIPMSFPKDTDNSSTNYETPYQSIGARGVNNLKNKLMLSLFPPNSPFFRLSLGSEIQDALKQDSTKQQKWEQALSAIEKEIMSYMENHQSRTTLSEALLQLLIAGNVLLFLPPLEGGMRLYRLNSYVVQRDGIGNVIEIVTRESIGYAALPDSARACIEDKEVEPEKPFDVFTHTYLQGEEFVSYQELNGKVIEGSDQTYPKDKSPWIPLRLVKMDGESYGRSFVDEYIGDLKVLESLSKSVADVAAVASNILYLVNPNAVTRVSELSKAKSGSFVKGKEEDIHVLQVNKTSDLQIALGAIQSIEGRLSYAFLLNSAVQRNAERVTAEEIRYVANELEDTVGSIYSILSQELQLPIVKRFMVQMERQGALKSLPIGSKGVELTITTGIEALGRGHDLNKLDTFIRYAQVFPEAFQSRVKQGAILEQIATALGIDANSVVMSDEEFAQMQQAAQQAQMQQQVAPEVVRGAMQQQTQ